MAKHSSEFFKTDKWTKYFDESIRTKIKLNRIEVFKNIRSWRNAAFFLFSETFYNKIQFIFSIVRAQLIFDTFAPSALLIQMACENLKITLCPFYK